MCCGTKRPRGKAVKLVVKPTMSGNEFVTVHDYLSAVPPWLMREDILWCMGLGDGNLLPPETELMVIYTGKHMLMISHKADWIRLKRDEPAVLEIID